MNLKLIKFLASICAGLCVIILFEWLYAIYAQKQLLSSIQAPDQAKHPAIGLPTIELTKQPETSYSELVSRPLFISGRRPVNETSTNDTKPAVAANQPFNWALNGVYTYKKGLYALFSRTTTKVPKDNYRKVTKDSDIDGWRLDEIEKDKVILTQGDQKKELPLRKPKPKDAAVPNPGNNGATMPQIPGQPQQPGMPSGQVPVPNPEQIPEPIPEPNPEEMEPVLEPELMPDESSETYFENNENEQFQ